MIARTRKKKLLAEYVNTYANLNGIASSTAKQYAYAVLALDTFVGRPLGLHELHAELVNEWIETRIAEGLSRKTVRNQACSIVTLWRAAYEDGLIKRPPMRIRRLKVPQPIPEAWTQEELQRLLAACDSLTGRLRTTRIRWRLLARAWILVAYYSGLRGCDLLTLPLDVLLAGRPFVVRQAKTDWPVTVILPADAIEAVRATVPPMRPLFLPVKRATIYDIARRLLKEAGLKGSPKWLRRTGATAVEAAQPGGSMAFLGHKTPGLSLRHYVDQRIAGAKRPAPPLLIGSTEAETYHEPPPVHVSPPQPQPVAEWTWTPPQPLPLLPEYGFSLDELRDDEPELHQRLMDADRLSGADVRDALKALHIKQEEFAAGIEYSYSHLQKVFNGHTDMSLKLERFVRRAMGLAKGGAA